MLVHEGAIGVITLQKTAGNVSSTTKKRKKRVPVQLNSEKHGYSMIFLEQNHVHLSEQNQNVLAPHIGWAQH